LALLEPDIDAALRMAKGLVPTFDSLTEPRQRALTSMAFNLGGRLMGFKAMLARIALENWEGVGQAMMDSKWATQVGERAERLKKMMVEG
jgi:lysozyme